MPVECGIEVRPVGQERFHAVDHEVMGHVFDIHNELGRFCDERVYQSELAHRCEAAGFGTHREVIIRAVHRDFVKPYFLDLVVEEGIIYELKSAEALTNTYEKQLINYLLLSGLSHGKLVNFRPGSVESWFVSTRLTPDHRTAFHVIEDDWQGHDEESCRLRHILSDLLRDWGAFLDVNLYREALVHFFGGAETVVRPVAIRMSGRVLGTQKVCLLDNETAWHLSAVRRHRRSYKTHIARLLEHTALKRLHWINLEQQTVKFTTLQK